MAISLTCSDYYNINEVILSVRNSNYDTGEVSRFFILFVYLLLSVFVFSP